MGKSWRNLRVVRRNNSKQDLIERALIPLVRAFRMGPTALARVLSVQLTRKVTKQEVSRILVNRNFSSKLQSIVPGLSVPAERRIYLAQLRMLWFHPSQKFKSGELLKRSGRRGYSFVNTRLPRRLSSILSRYIYSLIYQATIRRFDLPVHVRKSRVDRCLLLDAITPA